MKKIMKQKTLLIISLCIIFLLSLSTHVYNMSIKCMPIKLSIKAVPIALEKYSKIEEQERYLEGYNSGYLFTLIQLTPPKNYYSSLDEEKTPFADGYRSGKDQGFDDINKGIRRCDLVDYGYTPVELKGTIHLEFEQSEFIMSDGEKYWIEFPQYMVQHIKQGDVTAFGYLSPEGRYGHMSGYSREFVIHQIKE